MTDPGFDMTNAHQVLQKLMAGNQRYVASKQRHPNQTPERRDELSDGQQPIAVILGCSDSRVPPEVIFDRGLGDLFVVRTAGHVMDETVLGSIEYAAVHLHTPLILVLGHSRCGAVHAALEGADGQGHITRLAEKIQPALDEAREQTGDLADNAARANAKIAAERLKCLEPFLTGLVSGGMLKVVPAFYDMETGVVEVLPD